MKWRHFWAELPRIFPFIFWPSVVWTSRKLHTYVSTELTHTEQFTTTVSLIWSWVLQNDMLGVIIWKSIYMCLFSSYDNTDQWFQVLTISEFRNLVYEHLTWIMNGDMFVAKPLLTRENTRTEKNSDKYRWQVEFEITLTIPQHWFREHALKSSVTVSTWLSTFIGHGH